MYHILVAGAGYTGGAVARFFAGKKQKVYALARSPEKAARFAGQGIVPLVMDLTKPETLETLPPAHFVVVAAAPDERTEAAYRQVYLEGVKNLLDALKKNPKPFLIVYLSSTGVWPDQGGAWIDEMVPAAPDTERGRILLKAEEQVLCSGYPAVVLRLAGIYGPGRSRLAALQKMQASPPEDPRWMNLIHVEDIARAMPVIFNKAEAGSIIAAADDEPVLSPVFYAWLAEAAGRSVCAQFTAKPPSGKRIQNARLKALDFSFQYPTFREGYRGLIAAEGQTHA